MIKISYASLIVCCFTITMNVEGCLNRLIRRFEPEATVTQEAHIPEETFTNEYFTAIVLAYTDLRIIDVVKHDTLLNQPNTFESSAYLRFTIKCIQGLPRADVRSWYPAMRDHPLLTKSIRSIIHNHLTVSEKARLKMLLQNASDAKSRLAFAGLCNPDNHSDLLDGLPNLPIEEKTEQREMRS